MAEGFEMATRIFLCNRTDNSSINDLIKKAICSINKGYPYRVFWECGDIKTVKTGDAVFFKRTQDKPLGYFASQGGFMLASENPDGLGWRDRGCNQEWLERPSDGRG